MASSTLQSALRAGTVVDQAWSVDEVKDALARDRRIGMIQPQRPEDGAPLFAVGCVGRIGEVEALDDGGFNLVLEGESRFRLQRELEVKTPFRKRLRPPPEVPSHRSRRWS